MKAALFFFCVSALESGGREWNCHRDLGILEEGGRLIYSVTIYPGTPGGGSRICPTSFEFIPETVMDVEISVRTYADDSSVRLYEKKEDRDYWGEFRINWKFLEDTKGGPYEREGRIDMALSPRAHIISIAVPFQEVHSGHPKNRENIYLEIEAQN